MKIFKIPRPRFSFSSHHSDLSNLQSTADSNLRAYKFDDIKSATKNFSDAQFISKDKSGETFRGSDDRNKDVLIKVLDSGIIQGCEEEWLVNVTDLEKLRHTHLVALVGYCCEENHRILVYAFTSEASLVSSLLDIHGSKHLSWSQRLEVASGVAQGLKFLLRYNKPSIAIEYINTSNILFGHNWKSKLVIHFTIGGQVAIIDPQGHHKLANLLYRFSVVLLELLTGQTSISKPKINNSGEDFLEWNGRELKRSEDIINVMDKQLEGQYTPKSAEVAASLAYDAGLGNDPKKSTIETVVKRLELLEKLNLAFADLKSSSGRCISNEHHGDAWGK